jgi:hypothetical protein
MVGKRTVGCYSHIATTIYFLAYARHFDFDLKESNPGSFLDSVLVTIGSDSEEEDKNENDKENHIAAKYNIFARIEELKNTNHVRLMVSTNEIESHIFWSLLKSHEIHNSIFDVRL